MNFINSVFRKFSYRETGESKDEGEGGLKSSRFYYRPAFVLFALNARPKKDIVQPCPLVSKRYFQ